MTRFNFMPELGETVAHGTQANICQTSMIEKLAVFLVSGRKQVVATSLFQTVSNVQQPARKNRKTIASLNK